MVLSRAIHLPILLGLSHQALAAFGGAFSTGPVSNGNFIREAIATLIVPEGNTPFAGVLSLWVGMGTSNGDLIQTILDRHTGQGGTPCESITETNQWCGYAYTLKSSGDQLFGPQTAIVAGDRFTYHYIFNDDTQQYDQKAALNGDIVSTLSTDSGRAQGFGTAVECAAEDCGDVPAHQWVDVVLTMDQPDPNYGNTEGTNNANTSGFSSADGGKTWKVDTINIGETKFS